MSVQTVFLSHIHEEKDLALLIKSAIQDEFSGFVKVFVSSDGESIPSGANFLKRIESGLTECVAAIYLISPWSINRNWVNFELGAVWMKNLLSVSQGGVEIPTIPFVHSGLDVGRLPNPISNLNAIMANSSSQLEQAFKSIQRAVGVEGVKLKTDFDCLAADVNSFMEEYTLTSKIRNVVNLLQGKIKLEKVKKISDNLHEIDLFFLREKIIDSITGSIPDFFKKDMFLVSDGIGLYDCGGNSVMGGPTVLRFSNRGLKILSEIVPRNA